MTNEKQQRRNYGNISRFREHWSRQGVDVGKTFACRLRVRNRGLDRRVRTSAQLLPSGEVQLLDSEWFNSLDHYSRPGPDFQTYKITKPRRSLRIYGMGEKMGDYVYDIRPVKKKQS